MTGAAGALLMFGGIAMVAVVVAIWDYLAERQERKTHHAHSDK